MSRDDRPKPATNAWIWTCCGVHPASPRHWDGIPRPPWPGVPGNDRPPPHQATGGAGGEGCDACVYGQLLRYRWSCWKPSLVGSPATNIRLWTISVRTFSSPRKTLTAARECAVALGDLSRWTSWITLARRSYIWSDLSDARDAAFPAASRSWRYTAPRAPLSAPWSRSGPCAHRSLPSRMRGARRFWPLRDRCVALNVARILISTSPLLETALRSVIKTIHNFILHTQYHTGWQNHKTVVRYWKGNVHWFW